MANIYLLRHGETEWNASGNRYCGLTNISLSDHGIKQAKAAAAYLKEIPFSAAYSSTLNRAYETANMIMDPHGIHVCKDERIIELQFGLWEGKTKEQFISENPKAWEDWLKDPGSTRAGVSGENAMEVYQRSSAFFNEISKRHNNENVLVVAHNTVNRIFIAGSLGFPFQHYRRIHQDNTGITVFKIHHDEIIFHNINLNHHLKESVYA